MNLYFILTVSLQINGVEVVIISTMHMHSYVPDAVKNVRVFSLSQQTMKQDI